MYISNGLFQFASLSETDVTTYINKSSNTQMDSRTIRRMENSILCLWIVDHLSNDRPSWFRFNLERGNLKCLCFEGNKRAVAAEVIRYIYYNTLGEPFIYVYRMSNKNDIFRNIDHWTAVALILLICRLPFHHQSPATVFGFKGFAFSCFDIICLWGNCLHLYTKAFWMHSVPYGSTIAVPCVVFGY